MQMGGSASPSASTASLFLATTQSISAQQMHSTTRFSLWQLPHLHLQFPIEILPYDSELMTYAYERKNTFKPKIISHIDIVDICARKYT